MNDKMNLAVVLNFFSKTGELPRTVRQKRVSPSRGARLRPHVSEKSDSVPLHTLAQPCDEEKNIFLAPSRSCDSVKKSSAPRRALATT
jgi:hypothetical protein